MKKRWLMMLLVCGLALSLLACGGKKGNDTGSDSGNKQTQAQMSWQDQYDLGIRLLNEGNYEDAILAFQAAIRIDPKNVNAYLSLAEVHMQMGNKDKAQAVLQQGMDHCDASQQQALREYASENQLSWDFEEGSQTEDPKETTVVQAPMDGKDYVDMAEDHMKQGDEAGAVSVLQQGLDQCDEIEDAIILQYAQTNGYEADENGKLVKFDEEAYLATLKAEDKMFYYLDRESWWFEESMILDGKPLYQVTVSDVLSMASKYGWGQMQFEADNEAFHSYATTLDQEEIPFAWVHGEKGAGDGAIYEDMGVGSYVYDPNGEGFSDVFRGYALKPATGVRDIRIGDSLESVLAALGWKNAEAIGALLRNAHEDPIGRSNIFVYNKRIDTEGLSEGQKYEERYSISCTADGSSRENRRITYITVSGMFNTMGGSRGGVLNLTFAMTDDMALQSIDIVNRHDGQ